MEIMFYQNPCIFQGNFPRLDYNSLEVDNHHHQQQEEEEQINEEIGATSADQSSNQIVDCMLHNPAQQQQPPLLSSNFCGSNSFEKLSFADVMQFADFGPKLGLNQTKEGEEETGIDPVYFLKT
ncbi:basic helix-loop-helix DNA-binding superfamily protein [Perilla frutescens var. frutescens]|nr:basic helix-loop-helix DNA-binding superfamily protein [Perilla frutescens var. frutescens]